ncbi:N-terminal protein methyltransferase [Musa troglodytarum]|uniref:Alpha N-terminal protein methyltransferase 1 n=1 Tax=Musa troglodytarum TaxID=320322 RepID=A0A9E7GB51_9LILI|nr:N-terminal protein methyltransferase [Musa troglodytarum]
MDAAGLDSEGRGFACAREMWREEIGIGEEGEEAENGAPCKRRDWYQKGIAYWEGVEASVDGVLGGYGHVNDADVKGSEAFLKPLLLDRFGSGARHPVALGSEGISRRVISVKMYALVTDKRRGSNNGRGKTRQHKPAVIKS